MSFTRVPWVSRRYIIPCKTHLGSATRDASAQKFCEICRGDNFLDEAAEFRSNDVRAWVRQVTGVKCEHDQDWPMVTSWSSRLTAVPRVVIDGRAADCRRAGKRKTAARRRRYGVAASATLAHRSTVSDAEWQAPYPETWRTRWTRRPAWINRGDPLISLAVSLPVSGMSGHAHHPLPPPLITTLVWSLFRPLIPSHRAAQCLTISTGRMYPRVIHYEVLPCLCSIHLFKIRNRDVGKRCRFSALPLQTSNNVPAFIG